MGSSEFESEDFYESDDSFTVTDDQDVSNGSDKENEWPNRGTRTSGTARWVKVQI